MHVFFLTYSCNLDFNSHGTDLRNILLWVLHFCLTFCSEQNPPKAASCHWGYPPVTCLSIVLRSLHTEPEGVSGPYSIVPSATVAHPFIDLCPACRAGRGQHGTGQKETVGLSRQRLWTFLNHFYIPVPVSEYFFFKH